MSLNRSIAPSMEQMETAQRLSGCSFEVGGVPFRGKLKAPMEQMETAQRLSGCSFGVGGVPFRGKLKAPIPIQAGSSDNAGACPPQALVPPSQSEQAQR